MKPGLLIVAALIVFITTASADMRCGPRDTVLSVITGVRYAERLSSIGLGLNGVVIEVWGNPITGSFTITTTNTLGWTCIVFSGHGWEQRQIAPMNERDS
jgi:hypothetical protein